MTISKISNISNGFAHRANRLLTASHRVFIARGNFDNIALPSTIAAIKALYEGSSATFLPLGDMDGGGSVLNWVQRQYETDFSTVGLGVDVTATLVGITVMESMLDFASDLGNGEYTLLFVPDNINNVFFALSGVTLTTEGNLNIVEKDSVSKITFKASRKANKLTDVIKYKEILAA
jgi:hypothetical protein